MTVRGALRVTGTALLVTALVTLAVTAGAAQAAEGLKLCVPKREGASLVTPKHGKCPKGAHLTTLGQGGKVGPAGKAGSEGKEGKQGPEGKAGPAGTGGLTGEQVQTLQKVLPYIKFVTSGVAGSPTIIFSGVNVEVNSGNGETATVNGKGNLVVGYDEAEGAEQTGSNNLVVGNKQTFTSFGGIVGGSGNAITGPFASATGGYLNVAGGIYSAVSGGADNKAEAELTSVSGGVSNTAHQLGSSVGGGEANTANGPFASIGGGYKNLVAPAPEKLVGPSWGWIGGGFENEIENEGKAEHEGNYAAILGGDKQKTNKEFEHLP
jgi:hypothetical protein